MSYFDPAYSSEDLHSDAVMKSMGRSFSSETHRERWIARVKKNKLIDIKRQRSRRTEILRVISHLIPRNRFTVTPAERVHQIISMMPESLATILVMKMNKRSDKDVAFALWNDGSDAARVRLRRAREKAYQSFREIWDDQI